MYNQENLGSPFLLDKIMGLFSTKKKTYVNMSVSRMLNDGDIVSVDKAAILEYILKGDKRVDALGDSYVDYLNNQIKNSIGTRALGLIKWADQKYYYGSNASNIYSEGLVSLVTELESYLTSNLNQNVTVEYAKFGPVNSQHFVYVMMQDQYGYNPDTNILTGLGSDVYLEDFTVYYCQDTIDNLVTPDYLNPMGYAATSGYTPRRAKNLSAAHTPWRVDANAEHDYVIINTVRKVGESYVSSNFTLNFLAFEYSGVMTTTGVGEAFAPNEEINLEDNLDIREPDYFMVRYLDATNKTKYFYYKFGSGTRNELDLLFLRDVSTGKHLPNVYIRLKGEDMFTDDHVDTEAYKSSKVLCNKLGFNYRNIAEELMDNIDDKSDIKDLFISFRLNPNDDDPIIAEYFYHYFSELYKDADAKRVSTDGKSDNLKYISEQALGKVSYVISDNMLSTGVSFKGIGYRNVVGTIGDVGTFNSSYGRVVISTDGFRGRGIFNSPIYVNRHYFRQQVTATTYREYFVDALSIQQDLATGHTVSASGDSDNLVIPVDVQTVNKRMLRHKHWLLSKAMSLVVTTVKVVKIKWIQRGIFKVIMFVIAVIISFFTGGAGMVWYLALLQAIAYAVVIQVVITVISKLLTALGIDASIVAVIIAVIAIAVGSYANAAKTTVAGLNAVQIMQISNVAFGVSSQHIQIAMKQAIKAFETFKDMMEDKLDSIEEQRKLLGLEDGGTIDVYTLLSDQPSRTEIRYGESPVSFYERTLSVNAGLATTALLNNYVYLSLQLPTFESFMAKRSANYGY